MDRGNDDGCAATSGTANQAYYFSAPASPMHFLLSSTPPSSGAYCSDIRIATVVDNLEQTDFEFGLSTARSMSTAEELFVNGKIRPGFTLPDPLPDPESFHRRTCSVSPSRSPYCGERNRRRQASLSLKAESGSESKTINFASNVKPEMNTDECKTTSASTSRSSSSNSTSSNSSNGRSKRWGFVKDLLSLRRSKSEGRVIPAQPGEVSTAPRERSYYNANSTESLRLMHSASNSPVRYKENILSTGTNVVPTDDKMVFSNKCSVKGGKREEMKRHTTFLPYKQGFLFGCLGFRSSGYGAGIAHGFTRNVAVVSTRQR